MKRWLIRLVLLLLSSVCSLTVCEMGLRKWYQPRLQTSGWTTSMPNLNQLGLRGRSIAYAPKDFVVVLLGDSQVSNNDVAPEAMPEQRLEHYLSTSEHPVKVFSVAAPGYGQDQELLALRRYFAAGFRADLVLLWETRESDLWNNLFPTHWPKKNGAPKPTFWLNWSGTLSGPSEEYGEFINARTYKIVTLWREYWNSVSSRDVRWERFMPAAYEPLTKYPAAANARWQTAYDDPRYKYLTGDDISEEKSHLAVWLTPASARMKYAVDLMHALIFELRSAIVGRRGRLIAFEATRGSDLVAHDEDVYLLNRRYYRASGKQADETMQAVNKGFEYLDVPVTIPEWHGKNGNDLNEAAVDQTMRDLAAQLRKKHAVPEAVFRRRRRLGSELGSAAARSDVLHHLQTRAVIRTAH